MVTAADNITGLIGNTPLLKLNRVVPEDAADVYVKLNSLIRRFCQRPNCLGHD